MQWETPANYHGAEHGSEMNGLFCDGETINKRLIKLSDVSLEHPHASGGRTACTVWQTCDFFYLETNKDESYLTLCSSFEKYAIVVEPATLKADFQGLTTNFTI